MLHAFSFILTCIAACIVGIGSAWTVLDGDLKFNKVTLGQWGVWPLAGETGADPYTKAYLSRQGTVWMGVTEGLILTASDDRDKAQLTGRCIYTLEGKIPRGRLWTLTTETKSTPTPTPRKSSISQVHYITSNDTIWEEDGRLVITVSQKVQPGNWLQVGSNDNFNLVLRIYDTPLTSGALDNAIVTPSISRGDCS